MRFNISHILFRYLTLSYLKCFGIAALGFLAITSMLEYMELTRKFSSECASVSYKTILELTAFSSVSTISSFFPFIAFVGTILFFSIMHSRLELTVIKILGVSIWNIINSLLLGGIIIGVAYLTVFDSILVFSANQINSINSKINSEALRKETIVTNEKFWFRDTDKNGSRIICARRFMSNVNVLSKVCFFNFDSNGDFQESIYSETASIKDGNWNLKNAKVINLSGNSKIIDNILIPTELSLKKIDKITADPKGIFIWNVSKYISTIEKIGLSSAKYKWRLFHQIFSIFQTLALILLASVFCVRYNIRNPKRHAVKSTIALCVSFPIYFLNKILMTLGENGNVSIILSTNALLVLFSLICCFLLSRKQ